MFKQKEFEDSIQFQESTNNLLQAMNSLGCFKDKEKLKRELLKAEHNTGWLNDNNLSCNDGDDNDMPGLGLLMGLQCILHLLFTYAQVFQLKGFAKCFQPSHFAKIPTSSKWLLGKAKPSN